MLPRGRALEILCLTLGAAAVLWVYSPSLAGKFVYDDHHFVENNAAVRTLTAPWRFFTDPSTLSASPGLNQDAWRPLTTLSLAADYAAAGPVPGRFRLVNLLLHCCSVVLLYLLAGLLGLAAPWAGLAAAFFAFFPAGVEAFAWISGRSGALSTTLSLASLYCFARRVRGDGRGCLYAAGFFCAAALLSREVSAVLPLLAAAGLYLYGGRRRHYAEAALWLALPTAVFILLRFAVLGHFHQPVGASLSAGTQAALPFILFAKYAEITLWPFSMLVSYSDLVMLRLARPGFYLPFALLFLALYALLLYALRRRGDRAAAFGLAWYGLALLPVLNIAQMTFYMAERLLYLPAAGAALALGGAGQALASRPRLRSIFAAGALLLLAAFPAEIRRRLPVWADDAALWSYDARKNPHNYLTRMRLAEALAARGESRGAREALEAALASAWTAGQRSMILNQLGVLFASEGAASRAELYFSSAADLNPEDHLARFNLARCSLLKGDREAARRHAAEALRLSPGYTPAQELLESLPQKRTPARGGRPSVPAQ